MAWAGGRWDSVTQLTMRIAEVVLQNALGTTPPVGSYKVTNMFVDPLSGKLFVEYENTPIPIEEE